MVNLGLSRVDDAVAAKHPLCRRHRRRLRPADVHPEEVPVPLPVACAGGRGHRLGGQLLGDPSGVAQMQQPLALPGDGAAPRRQGCRSAQLGELHLGRRRPGAENFEPSGPPHLRLALPPHTGPPHSLR
ncbi:transmembrane protein 141 isoform X3 [Mustela putorius furo]|uniref:Transmembrane protein 141 isoform X3 n=1 Tax=Mustela putorius furo TaxID=9669 RepID=A0A8U0S9W6_MUSPF|nr:transmembrane protein 141 isoform X3 [Mustela putorius furo]